MIVNKEISEYLRGLLTSTLCQLIYKGKFSTKRPDDKLVYTIHIKVCQFFFSHNVTLPEILKYRDGCKKSYRKLNF